MKRFGKGTATLVLLLVTMTTAVGFADDCTSCDYTSVYEICDVPDFCCGSCHWVV